MYFAAMCCIAGIISPHRALVTHQLGQRMAHRLQHRGPDDEGMWQSDDEHTLLVHRRLSIIDISEAGHQPMQRNEYTIVYNGELYNYVELRTTLQALGQVFTTQSDTEVIMAAVEVWGITDALQQFDGMFAFAIHHQPTQTVWIARDRYGEKPLYYHVRYGLQNRAFESMVFASEIKALWEVGAPKNINGTRVLNYLTLGMVQNPLQPTQTFYNDILQLPPGNFITVQPALGKLQMRRWYKPELQRQQAWEQYGNLTVNEAITVYQQLLQTSVQRRLRSDVAVGMSVSGGIDSAAIAATALQQSNTQHFHFFTAGFPGFEKDETVFAQQVAAHYPNRVTHHIVTPTANDLATQWQRFMTHQEMPVQSASVFTQYCIYQAAKAAGVIVLLDGQGADEVLGGYERFVQWYLVQLWRTDKKAYWSERKQMMANGFVANAGIAQIAAGYFPEKAAAHLQKKAINQQYGTAYIDIDFSWKYRNPDTLEKPVIHAVEDILWYSTHIMGLQALLQYADRNSMAFGSEIRLPYLMHNLVNFSFAQPSHYKFKDGYTKWLLRKAVEPHLPQGITWRKGKIGYEPPQQQWLLQPAMKAFIHEARHKLVQAKMLHKSVLQAPINAANAHAANNFDWRYLCVAAML
ncbi:MAG TPA: asparagine synthase (glutamine-hydrolyzing) [Chitinophagaceae bacterium]|nr:asparagine synthase (glutamine-hydrolyzing) [Chitinophagaceae bacterium]